MFSARNLSILPGLSYIIGAQTTGYTQNMSYSPDSYIDYTFIKFSSASKFEWASTVDYLKGYDQDMCSIIFGDLLYISISTSNYYY